MVPLGSEVCRVPNQWGFAPAPFRREPGCLKIFTRDYATPLDSVLLAGMIYLEWVFQKFRRIRCFPAQDGPDTPFWNGLIRWRLFPSASRIFYIADEGS
jgi:hypothetical protein